MKIWSDQAFYRCDQKAIKRKRVCGYHRILCRNAVAESRSNGDFLFVSLSSNAMMESITAIVVAISEKPVKKSNWEKKVISIYL